MAAIEKVKGTIIRNSMFSPGDVVIVAVSGGADSVFLLYTLLRLRHQFGIHLHVVHLNHGLRKSAERDQKFVEALSKKLNLPLTVGILKGRTRKKRQSLEDFARQERFQFLSREAKKHKARVVALGHTRSDSAETVLMRILRGAGLYGLRGILPVREMNGQTYVRPLLDVTRKEVEQFLRKEGIKFCRDETNASTQFFRNKIRLRLLPILRKEYNKDIDGVLANLAKSVSADYHFLFRQIPKELKTIFHGSKQNGMIRLPISRLKRLPPALQRLSIRFSIEQLQGDLKRVAFDHVETIKEMCGQNGEKKIFLLPKGLRAYRQGNNLVMTLKKRLIKSSDTL